MTSILGVGIATLDIINVVDHYPQENQKLRALNQHIRRGGNVTNSLITLSQLGHRCSWAGVLTARVDDVILEDLKKYHIDYKHCTETATGDMPTSYITLNRSNGSRTIVHFRNIPEFDFQAFKKIDLSNFEWVHFEGRNVEESGKMLVFLRDNYPSIIVSIEIEKKTAQIESLFNYADILFLSKDYAYQLGYKNPMDFLTYLENLKLKGEIICAWGDQGAYAISKENEKMHSPAFVPSNIIETLGAGDVFIGGYISAKLRGSDCKSSLTEACKIAGVKCGQWGFDGFGHIHNASRN